MSISSRQYDCGEQNSEKHHCHDLGPDQPTEFLMNYFQFAAYREEPKLRRIAVPNRRAIRRVEDDG